MSQSRETVLTVRGMSCASCVRHVDQALKQLDGVADVEVHLREGKVHVWHDAARAPAAALLEAVTAAGYEASARG